MLAPAPQAQEDFRHSHLKSLAAPVDQAIDNGQIFADVEGVRSAKVFSPLRQDLGDFFLLKFTGSEPHHSVDSHAVAVISRGVLSRTIQIPIPIKWPSGRTRVSHVRLYRVPLVRFPWTKGRFAVVKIELV